jgi:hypothetical protein
MTNPVDDIFQQANQGSVAAIIQVLNDKLADSGVRTRAILADGILQLLCEAQTPDQLDASTLVERVRQILEAIAPKGIRRVNINSRIVREQQLLWLDEIRRDPIGQLLWSQEITLKQLSPLQRFQSDRRMQRAEAQAAGMTAKSPRQLREQRQFQRGGMIGGISAALLLLLGWVVYSNWGSIAPASLSQKSPPAPAPSAASPDPKPQIADPFAAAVQVATQASQDGLVARTSAEWLALATRWQEASDLMAKVPSTDSRYLTAQNRVTVYQQNREAALLKAKQ